MRRISAVAGCAVTLLLFAGSGVARADIIFSTGVSNQGTSNVLFNDAATGSDVIAGFDYVRGHIGNTPTGPCTSGNVCVDVAGEEALFVNNAGGGQATIRAVDGGFDVLDIFLTDPPGGVYTKVVFAVTGVGTGQAGAVAFDIIVTEGDGTINTQSFVSGSGNTFYTVVAINGQDIRNVRLLATGENEFETLRQLRLGGFENFEVPEPASMLLFGTALLGFGLVRGRRR